LPWQTAETLARVSPEARAAVSGDRRRGKNAGEELYNGRTELEFRLHPGFRTSQNNRNKHNETTKSMKIFKKLTFAALAARAVMLLLSTQIMLAGALVLLVLPARADTFGSGTNKFSMNSVEISNPGNGDDLGAGGGSYSAG